MTNKELGRGVAIVGAGMTKFGAFTELATRDLFVEAFREMITSTDKGFDPRRIEALYLGNYSSDLFEGQWPWLSSSRGRARAGVPSLRFTHDTP